ncbi:hypothetical protein B0H12DRAFT_1222952 [Mycena haematopus]|nr:hypothetical protein B0H12DRAFT_1222952 [Mycena haematopus]
MVFPFTSLRKPTTRPPLVLLVGWFVGLALIPRVAAQVSVNRTIDDTFGDPITGLHPTFGPNGWDDNFCGVFALLTTQCGAGDWAPNTVNAFNQTFHFTYSASQYLSLQFIGTAIYVYTLVINSTQHNLGPEAAFGGAGFTAQMDGGQLETEAGGDLSSFSTLPAYNVLLYSKTGLENTTHSLTIRPLKSELLFFDYAVYTFEESDSPSSSPSSGSSSDSLSSGSLSSGSLSSGSSGSSSTSSPSPPTRPAASGSSSASSSPSAVSSSFATAKKKSRGLAGPIAGGIIGGLSLLGALALLLYCAARRRKTATGTSPNFASNTDEKRPAPWPKEPIPRNLTPTAGFIYEGWAPQTWSEAAISLKLSPVDQATFPSPRESTLEEEEKNMVQDHLTHHEEAGRQIALLEQQIRDLTEEARPSLPSESMNTITPRRPPDQRANSQLVAQIRSLRGQIDAIRNEMETSDLPQYTAGDIN